MLNVPFEINIIKKDICPFNNRHCFMLDFKDKYNNKDYVHSIILMAGLFYAKFQMHIYIS